MARGFDAAKLLFDLSVLNHERAALDAHDFFPIHVLFLHDPERRGELLVGIGEERERDFKLLLEFLECGGLIGGDADDRRAGLLELLVCVAKLGRLDVSTRRVCLREEIQYQCFTCEIRQGTRFSVLVEQIEIRRFIMRHMSHLPRPTCTPAREQRACRGFRAIITVVIFVAVLCGIASAQQRRKQRTPRAIALVEWPANRPSTAKSGEQGTSEPKGKPVVVPIAILIDGRFYDASIYRADPVPMALEGGTVYEVQQSGDALGFATIDGAANSNGSWIGIAKYQSKASLAAAEKKRQVPPVRPDPEEGPPKLRKGGSKPGEQAPASTTPSSTPPAEAKPQASKDDDEGRPTLRKPAEAQPGAPGDTGAGVGSKPGTEAKKSSGAGTTPAETKAENAPKTPPGPPDTEPDEDSTGRPRLRRGKPVQANAESAPAPAVARTATTSSTSRTREAQSAGPVRVLPAISDATVTESRPFVMPGSETISSKLNSGMSELARAALDKFAASHGGVRVGPLEKVEIRAFDLSLTNQATVVLFASAHPAVPPAPSPTRRTGAQRQTAPAPAAPVDPDLTFWVTIVARENYNGDLRQLAAWTTDSKHLDAYPRMELIDAIDADGDGKGELLFRAVNDLGRAFVISRVTADQVVSLYDSGELAR